MTRGSAGTIRFEVTGFSEQGPRDENQDAFATDAFESLGLIALADGMGGEKSGRVAAHTALDALRAAAPIRSVEDARRAVREADRKVTESAEADLAGRGGMGCALGLLALTNGADGPGWIAAHVGDVRILSRSPDGMIRLETRDHTPAFARWEAGEITLDEIPDSSGANRLQRAVGRGGEADVGWFPAAPGWTWMLLSDGIYKAMRLDELARAMAAPSTTEACQQIRSKVEERGPEDNFTAVVVRAIGDASPAAAAPGTSHTTGMTSHATTPPAGRASSGGSTIAIALALLALALAGLAFWTARSGGADAAQQSEVSRLRTEVDSLRAVISEVVDPFGPTAPAAAPGILPGGSPATQSATTPQTP